MSEDLDKLGGFLRVFRAIVALTIAMVVGAIIDRVIVNRKLDRLYEVLKEGDVKALKSWP